jgi:hypothetical protein
MPQAARFCYDRPHKTGGLVEDIPMDDRLLKSCAREFEAQVADIFAAQRNQPCVLCEIPILG